MSDFLNKLLSDPDLIQHVADTCKTRVLMSRLIQGEQNFQKNTRRILQDCYDYLDGTLNSEAFSSALYDDLEELAEFDALANLIIFGVFSVFSEIRKEQIEEQNRIEREEKDV